MANNFIASSKINIFPAARSGNYPNAYRLSEQTITELIRSLLSNQDGFVIGNHDLTWSSTSGTAVTFSFILGGYLISFSSNEFNSITSGATAPIWACIFVDNNGNLNNLSNTGNALDDGNPTQFEGVKFISSENRPSRAPSPDYSYALKILEKAGDTWRIPEDSKLQFTTSTNTRAIKIDDGDLTNYS